MNIYTSKICIADTRGNGTTYPGTNESVRLNEVILEQEKLWDSKKSISFLSPEEQKLNAQKLEEIRRLVEILSQKNSGLCDGWFQPSEWLNISCKFSCGLEGSHE